MNTAIWTEKYRPDDFSEVKGQKDVVKRVEAFVKQKNMPHLMFSGPAGGGKTTLALVAAKQLFGGSGSEMSDSMPTITVGMNELDQGIPAYLLFEKAGLCKTRSEARRLISQGGGYINDSKIEAFDQVVDMDNMVED